MSAVGNRWGKAAGLLVGASLLVGCTAGGRRTDAVFIANPTLGPMTIAVAPVLNLSGSKDFDRNRLADLMASELSYADGITVIPVSRVLGILAAQGLDGVESPTHALELVALLGADAILVIAVSEYDPYDPPSVGLSAQLFGTRPGASGAALDPTALSRRANLAASAARGGDKRLLAQTQRVFSASHESVVAGIREYAALRSGDDSPYGWRKFVVSQQHFIRYCCYATIRDLLSGRQGSGSGDVGPEG